MKRFLVVLIFFGFWAGPAAALSQIQSLVQYDCQAASCKAVCTGPNTGFTVDYRTLTVFQWKAHIRRLWLAANDRHIVLGDDVSCTFEGRPTFEFDSSPLPPVKPACTCIGNQCTPPGCRP
jgi:hypothetical protein